METQIKPGYKAYNGYVFDDYDCKRYNRVQDRIAAFKKASFPIPDGLLYESHRCFVSIISRVA